MSSSERHQDDPLLEALLDEVVGGQTPPDLSDKILRALADRQAGRGVSSDARSSELNHSDGNSAGVAQGPIPVPEPHAAAQPPSTAVPADRAENNGSLADRRRSRSSASWVVPLTVAASVLIAVGVYWLNRPGDDPLAHDDRPAAKEKGSSERATRPDRDPSARDESDPRSAEPGAAEDEGSMPAAEPGEGEPEAGDSNSGESEPDGTDPGPDPSVFAAPHRERPATGELDESVIGEQTTSRESSVRDREVIAYIDGLISERWKEHGVKPSAEATDGEWVRRVYLDVIGRIPTHEEAVAYLNDLSPDRKERLVDHLLAMDEGSSEHLEEYARTWTTTWARTLIGHMGGREDSMADRGGLQHYLRRAFLKNKPYDQMVYELITATGSNQPGAEDYNPAVNFLLNEIQTDLPENQRTTRATAKVARIFLGQQVQCTQCHNHPFNDWKQAQFWGMDAFFRQMQRVRGDDGARLVDRDFAGESGKPHEADIFYEQRNGLLMVAYPTFVDGTKIDPSGLVDEVNRRQRLAELIVDSERMPKAAVNRVWSHFLGYGFTKPVDDMGPHNQPSHPELLDRLAGDFAAGGYNLKQLIRWVVLSKPYALSSRIADSNEQDDPEAGLPPLFSRFYVRQIRPDELYNSLQVATRSQYSAEDFSPQQRAKEKWLDQFVQAFGNDEGMESTTFNGTIPQTLMMMNGDLVKQAVSGPHGSFLHEVANSKLSDADKIDALFLAALSRRPTRKELQVAQALWHARGGDTTEALKDVWWAVLNSNEFILQH